MDDCREELAEGCIGNSFNIDLPIDEEEQIHEKSMDTDLNMVPEVEKIYEIIPGGAKKGGDLLTCPNLYTYARFSKNRPHTWRCSQRGSTGCRTIVREFLGKCDFLCSE